MKVKLIEDLELYKGIFWIVNLEDIYSNRNYCFTIPSDSNGNTISDDLIYSIDSKSGATYNHKNLWDKLPKDLTHNKLFDYFPRGRVQIANGRADIYLNPNINLPEVIEFIKDEFNLNSHNGITKVRAISDGSEHYKCFLDK